MNTKIVEILLYFNNSKQYRMANGVGRKFSREGKRKKDRKLAKKYRKIALFSLFQGGNGKKTEKQQKKGRK